MKFNCNTEFFDGTRLFYGGNSYDLNEDAAKRLIDMANKLEDKDENKPLGALAYFDPADDDAEKLVKANKGKLKKPTDDDAEKK